LSCDTLVANERYDEQTGFVWLNAGSNGGALQTVRTFRVYKFRRILGPRDCFLTQRVLCFIREVVAPELHTSETLHNAMKHSNVCTSLFRLALLVVYTVAPIKQSASLGRNWEPFCTLFPILLSIYHTSLYRILTFWRWNYFFLILAHPVYKM